MRHHALLAASLLAFACSVDLDPNHAVFECDSAADCGDGGFSCIPRPGLRGICQKSTLSSIDPARADPAANTCEDCDGTGVCKDFGTDTAHCGGCGIGCPNGASCSDGRCLCRGGRMLCGDRCVDLAMDGAHCGGCDLPCATGLVCASGRCRNECPLRFTACTKSCVDVTTSNEHCGGCFQACAGVCRQGHCT